DRTSFARGHALWRGVRNKTDNKMWGMFDLNVLNQDPASPHPRVGATLTSSVPIDANQNPSGAFLNDTRVTAAFGMDRSGWPASRWITSGSFSHSGQDIFRGFLSTVADAPENATGFFEKIDLLDLYADSHLMWSLRPTVRLVAGGDFLHGLGEA